MEFVKGVSMLISLFSVLSSQPPFYKLYHNAVSKDFMKAVEVREAPIKLGLIQLVIIISYIKNVSLVSLHD